MTPWAEAVLRALEYQRVPVFTVHYACEDWNEVGTSRTPRVTAIAVDALGHDINKLFSLALMAEREQVAACDLEARGEFLEAALLEEFGCFLERMAGKYPHTWWFHWAMRDTTFGWPLLEHRYRTLTGKNLKVQEDQLVDFHAALVHDYGADFVPRPRFLNLVARNGLASQELLHGAEEALAHRRGDYRKVGRSVAKKAEAIAQLLEKYVRRILRTDAVPRRKLRRVLSSSRREPVLKELVGAEEAARICGVSRATLYRLKAAGKIPAPHKIGRRSLWREAELRGWAATLSHTPVGTIICSGH